MSFAPNPFVANDDALVLREWYVRVDAGETVGPVSADQIARGIKLGRVPTDAMLARFDQTDWANVLDSSAIVAALRSL
jgi:hypothetical protein